MLLGSFAPRTSRPSRGAVALWLTGLLCAACGSSTPSGSSAPRTHTTNGAAAVSGNASAATGSAGQNGFGNADPLSTAGTGSSTPGKPLAGGAALGCKNLQCQQHSCPNGGSTTISGRIYDPAAKNPLYDVAVYIPNEAVSPIALGASCDKCETLYTGKAVVSTLTDADGQFTLKDAPDGSNIPLVVQIGKWRMQYVIPSVTQCQDNPLPDKMYRLPRNHMEGDIPNIAISTGSADTLECLLRRVGLDASEYVPGDTGDGRIHIFQGTARGGFGGRGMPVPNTSPSAPSSPTSLWDSKDDLMKYDVVLLSCEGTETQNMNQQALHDYASAGGRVFASHFHYAWFNTGPYGSENLATWSTGSNDMGNIGATIVTSFPKGMALQQWLMNTNALTNGELPIEMARHNADVTPMNTPSQAWIMSDNASQPPNSTEYFSFNTPTDAVNTPDGPGFCGRVVFSDLHVGAASHDDPTMPVPTSCANVDLSPQEKALEFMLFDLSSCVIPDDRPPAPPPIVQ